MKKQHEDDGRIRPLQVPAKHAPQAPLDDRVVFALADIGSGTAKQVAERLVELKDPDADTDVVESILESLFNNGLVNGTESKKARVYDLAKVTRPHHGHVDPENINNS
ncbi:hypothetical protein [Parapedobacter koreensis]|uniref:Penicillinase repressor n=1 Tax=Parapedobacter koreensis TaxID=332977 RepID=A0A1H7T5R3_9SPHI|nr:hypothetical protein [Parapedobacter koreensis]SEL79839.1 hypothetical protein SAMN05421740_11090 [Parapedobacter koreensis]